MEFYTDPDDIKASLDRLATTYGISESDIGEIKDDINNFFSTLIDKVNELETDNEEMDSHIKELVEEIRGIRSHGVLEEFVASILQRFTGNEPNAGTVISLTDDLKALLVSKYGISEGVL